MFVISTREGRNIGEILTFIQDMFAVNNSTEVEVTAESPVIPGEFYLFRTLQL